MKFYGKLAIVLLILGYVRLNINLKNTRKEIAIVHKSYSDLAKAYIALFEDQEMHVRGAKGPPGPPGPPGADGCYDEASCARKVSKDLPRKETPVTGSPEVAVLKKIVEDSQFEMRAFVVKEIRAVRNDFSEKLENVRGKPGPMGMPGVPGMRGEDGKDGEDGEPGVCPFPEYAITQIVNNQVEAKMLHADHAISKIVDEKLNSRLSKLFVKDEL